MNPNAMPSPNQETPTTSGESLPSDARGSLSLSLCLPGYHYRMSAEEKENYLIPLGLTTLQEIREFANGPGIAILHMPEFIVKPELDMDSLESLDSSAPTDTQSNAASDNNQDIDASEPFVFYQPVAERVKVRKRACTERKGAASE
ncbi:uncharacterized protein LOC117897981 [Drosophila subobscura]|uniref:uncharacterized protein LOC117897981 n=1 Tax=Drosophila subobscura TaxID=7241 RepID=UPI00155A3880|nr:uncharacterized protein LOC117897981 [Drosophila subobscura]